MLQFIFSWETVAAGVGILLTVGLGVLALDDFKIAKACFSVAATQLGGGIVMFGAHTHMGVIQRIFLVGIMSALVGVVFVESLRYVDQKQAKKHQDAGDGTQKTLPPSGKLACQVASVSFEPVFRLFQSPPVYFQRLDTMLRVSLTNQTEKPQYIRKYSVAALRGVEWVAFKNADSAALEPYAFGVINDGSIGRFDLSDNGFDYITHNRPINQDESIELWMFFISGLTRKDQPGISQFKFRFYNSANEEFTCTSPYSIQNDRGIVIGRTTGDLKFLNPEPIPLNLREEPPSPASPPAPTPTPKAPKAKPSSSPSINQGPGSIAQIGGVGNTATINNFPPRRKLSQEQTGRITAYLSRSPHSITIGSLIGDEEAAEFAISIADSFEKAGWKVERVIGRQMMSGTMPEAITMSLYAPAGATSMDNETAKMTFDALTMAGLRVGVNPDSTMPTNTVNLFIGSRR